MSEPKFAPKNTPDTCKPLDQVSEADLCWPGRDASEQQRNRDWQQGFVPERYLEGITGFAGQNLQRICRLDWQPAIRVRIGPAGNYKAGLALRPDGVLVAAVCRPIRGPGGPGDLKFWIFIYHSADQGLTWQDTGAEGLFGKEPSLTALADGALVLTAQYCEDAAAVPRMPVWRSADGGWSWDLSWLSGNRDYPRNLLLDRQTGELVMIRSLARKYWHEKHAEASPHLEIARSADQGRTWRTQAGRMPWDFTGFSELSSLQLPDGRLLAAIRREPPGTRGEGYEDTLLTESADGGRTFSQPWRVSRTGEVHWQMIRLLDGRLLATYTNYHLPYGICAVVSEDEGKTWHLDRPWLLACSSDIYVGWPVTVQLADQSLVTIYAATTYLQQPPDTTTCEVVRWQLQ